MRECFSHVQAGEGFVDTIVNQGSITNPPALAFAGEQAPDSDASAVSYATVYPLTMFLRVLFAQLMILVMV